MTHVVCPSYLCDVCNKARRNGKHDKCSKIRQKLNEDRRAREAAAAERAAQ